MYVKTDYTGCEYVTAGKVYEVVDNEEYHDFVQGDDGGPVYIHEFGGDQVSLRLGGLLVQWTICDKEGNEL